MDNLTWTPEEHDILHLRAKVDIEFIPRFDAKWSQHIDTLNQYQGRHQQNYNDLAIQRSIQHQDRFNIGALCIYLNGELSRSLMLEKYRDWMLLSRLISHNHPRLPILTAYGQEPICELESANQCEGVFATIDFKNKMYRRCIDTNQFKLFNADYPLYVQHREVVKDIRLLEGTREFLYTQQYVLYRGQNIEEVFNA